MHPTAAPLHEQFLPLPPPLRPVTQHLMVLTVAADAAPVLRTLLPTFQVLLLFNLGPAGTELWPLPGEASGHSLPLCDVLLAGPLKTAWRYRLPAGARVLAVTFTLGGSYRLFGVPTDRLPAGFADPAGLLPPPGLMGLAAQLRAATHDAQLPQLFAEFCRSWLGPAEPAQQALLAHLPALIEPGHRNPLQVMAATDRVSERTWQLRFQKYLGFSVKEALRFQRFRQLLAALPPNADFSIDWQTLLVRFGYYDQSHLVHDFAYFLRQSPTQTAGQLLAGDALCLPQTQLLAVAPHQMSGARST